MFFKFIRVYTPFVCTLATLLECKLFEYGEDSLTNIYLLSGMSGASLLLVVYMWIVSLKMCIWYRINLMCLFLIQICGILYNCFDMEFSLYLWRVTLLSEVGMLSFLIFMVYYKITGSYLRIGKYSRKSL